MPSHPSSTDSLPPDGPPASTPTPFHPPDSSTIPGGPSADEKRPVSPPPVPRRYRLKKPLGSGGMGDIWLGRDRGLRRPVAVKVAQARWAGNRHVVRRFLEEAQLTGRLAHPAIPPVYEMGELPDGRPYFCMKVVQGRTLASLLEGRAGPGDDLPRLLAVFEQVCQAVAYAHSKGVIHRDLKPSNVMVGAFGEVRVMDWGLAKVLKSRDRHGAEPEPVAAVVAETGRGPEADNLTQTGMVLGTFGYLAPDQARGEVERLDKRCGVFGLGAILCEILTGKAPYQGSREEIRFQAHLGMTQWALGRLAACPADGELTALARGCLSTSADDRPAGAPPPAAPTGRPRCGSRSSRRPLAAQRRTLGRKRL